MSTTHPIPSHAAPHCDMLAAFTEHLIEAFQMPVEQALERVNRELEANPLTRHVRLRLDPDPDQPGPEAV
jgi:hypothetical protein